MKYVCDVCGWEYDEEIGKDQFSNAEQMIKKRRAVSYAL